MKKLSIFVAFVTVALALASYAALERNHKTKALSSQTRAEIQKTLEGLQQLSPHSAKQLSPRSGKQLSPRSNKQLSPRSSGQLSKRFSRQLPQRSGKSVAGNKEARLLNDKVKALQNQLASLETGPQAKEGVDPVTLFWIKLAFSAFFGAAAMFVVLSGKYDEDTKRWAFSVLSLISGVWIGTIS